MSKVLAANKMWGSVIITILSTGLISSIGFAWNANSQQAVMQEQISNAQKQLSAMDDAKLPERMARIEETVKSTDKTVDDIKIMQRDMGRKLDIIVQNQMGKQ